MSVRIAPGLAWLPACYDLSARHKHVGAYLLGETGRQVLVDTGAPVHREAMLEMLSAATDGAGPAAIVLTHGDLPHTGNVAPVRARWSDVPVYAATAAPEILGFDPSIHCEVGSERSVAGRRLVFLDPPLADIRSTMWVYDHGTGALLTGDGLGHYHDPGRCRSLEAPIDEEAIADYHRDTFVWLPYAHAETLCSALSAAIDRFAVEHILPIHGRPVSGSEVSGYLDRCTRHLARLTAADPPGEP